MDERSGMSRLEKRSEFPQFTLRSLLLATTISAAALGIASQAVDPLWRASAIALPAIMFGFWLGFVGEHMADAAARSARVLGALIGVAGAGIALCGFIVLLLAVVVSH